jgi:hypothetical protein
MQRSTAAAVIVAVVFAAGWPASSLGGDEVAVLDLTNEVELDGLLERQAEVDLIEIGGTPSAAAKKPPPPPPPAREGLKAKDAEEIYRQTEVWEQHMRQTEETLHGEAQRRSDVKMYSRKMKAELIGRACSPALCQYLLRQKRGIPQAGYSADVSPLSFNTSANGKPLKKGGWKEELTMRKSEAHYAHTIARSTAANAAMKASENSNRRQRTHASLRNNRPFRAPEQERDDAALNDNARYMQNLDNAARQPRANSEPYPTNATTVSAAAAAPAPAPAALSSRLRLGASVRFGNATSNGNKSNATHVPVDETARRANALMAEEERTKAVNRAQEALTKALMKQQANYTQMAQADINKRISKCKCSGA